MWEKLAQINERHNEIIAEMSKPEVASDRQRIMRLAQEKSAIDDIVVLYRDYQATVKSLEQTRAMLDDKLDSDMQAG